MKVGGDVRKTIRVRNGEIFLVRLVGTSQLLEDGVWIWAGPPLPEELLAGSW